MQVDENSLCGISRNARQPVLTRAINLQEIYHD